MFWSHRRIYLDHASATPVRAEALAAMRKAEQVYGNPGAIHAEGVAAKKVLEEARAAIAAEFGVKSRQLLFTSGSTEGNNLCILGTAQHLIHSRGSLAGTHWIVSAIEHPSVLECFAEIERLGGLVTHLDPAPDGRIRTEMLERALRDETVLVSIGWANHEIGTVQQLRALSEVLRKRYAVDEKSRPLLHSDLGQAPLYLVPHMHSLGVDLAVAGSGKLYGPRGVGTVYLSNRAEPQHLSFGGGQERGLRAGTESPALAAGFAAALTAAGKERVAESVRVCALRDELATVLEKLPGVQLNTTLDKALPHLLNISIPGVAGEYAVLSLDKEGIAVSTRSACNAGETRSHVVAAVFDEPGRAESTIRFSSGRDTTRSQIRRVAQAVTQIAAR